MKDNTLASWVDNKICKKFRFVLFQMSVKFNLCFQDSSKNLIKDN